MAKLYLVPTPIGNLEDITLRAIRILKEVDVVLAEDTRTSGFLLKHFNIEKKIFSHHQHNEHKTVALIAERISNGQSVALVSDAGTPGISDPGFLLVRECLKNNIEVECLPGPVAFIPALINSGLASDRFCFEGFLPHKKGKQTKIQNLKEEERTMIFYESPYRLIKTLQQFAEAFGPERQASVSRELTKKFEQTVRGSLEQVIKSFETGTVKGEIVIVVAGKKKEKDDINSPD
ncbi:MAG: 16S rRNA (cytidine(1402)-2'-O)-methyltransferase [Bacteroidetes bacterium]|nr:16S rRNA (cytidine(1402)-2'-O)-methyltransferase [Bacteroidota bacterium]HET6244753.1 16S rRNA (cytidine(1402)-2'-O)-methyltransferase [Bacteroidia bacterium]